jgi:thiol-disulfide isomerase/thioredoxin
MERERGWFAPAVRTVLVVVVMSTLAVGCGSSSGSDCASGKDLLPASPTALPTMDVQQFRELMCQLHGKPVVVNVWASWCGPCIVEAPELAAVAKDFQGQVQFLGVDIQDQPGPAKAFISKEGWIYPSVFDPTGAIRDSFGVLGVPHTLFYDANGEHTFTWSGPVRKPILESGIRGALHRGSGSPAPSPSGS